MQNKKNIFLALLTGVAVIGFYFFLINKINVPDKSTSSVTTSATSSEKTEQSPAPLSFDIFLDNKKIKTFNPDSADSIVKPVSQNYAVFEKQKMVSLKVILEKAGINSGKEVILVSLDGQSVKMSWNEVVSEKELLTLISTNSNTWKVIKGDAQVRKPGSFLIRGLKTVNIFSRENNSVETEISNALKRCGNTTSYNNLNIALKEPEKVCILQLAEQNLPQVPQQISKFVNLIVLYLGRNNISDLSPAIGELSNLDSLNIDNNELSNLPKEISKLKKLTVLKAGRNKLNMLPREIGYLTSLKFLELDNNAISSIPSDIGLLSNLETLDLKNNKLHSLPKEISNLKNLKELELSGNNFSDDEKNKVQKMLPFVKIAW